MAETVYEFTARKINGEEESLDRYRGKTLLIVNTASKCGFTPQYEGLETLYEDLRAKGLEILAFPCNQFGNQEPGDEAQIAEFCETRFHTSFPLFAKVDVNGANAHPLYEHLKSEAPGLLGSRAIKWNFTKFLVGPDGKVIRRYAPKDAPESLRQDLEQALTAGP